MFINNMPQTFLLLIRGSRHERFHAFASLLIWFAAGGFIFSTFGVYIDNLIAADLTNPAYPVVAGIVTALISTLKSAA